MTGTSTMRAASRYAQRRVLPALLAVAMAGPLAAPGAAAAAPAAAPQTEPPAAAAGAGSTQVTFSLKQLGAQYPLELRGIEAMYGVPFSVRADEVVTAATLHLSYAASPALIPELSHINVLVNGEVAGSIPLPKEQGGMNVTRDVAIPPRLITEFNQLNLQLIGHYTMQCEDPAHSSLWTNISNNSTLTLTVTRLKLDNDLALLPLPFFDRRDIRPLRLPVVFAGAPDRGTLETAGVLTSWFGALAGYRGASFPVLQGALPEQGNAIVLLPAGASLPGVDAPATQGAGIAVIDNPNDAGGKLLLITGSDAAQLKTAATALALGSATLTGPSAAVTGLQALAPRKPYDAPNWLRDDRPVKFGELAAPATLAVSGYTPDLIRVNFRTPPDLFGWRSRGIPVDLRYRYTPRTNPDKSTLNISINNRFLRSEPLRAVSHDAPGYLDRLFDRALPPDGTRPSQLQFHVPLYMLPSHSQLQFHYYYDYIKQGDCKDVVLDNVRGVVDPDSTIDISGFSHFMAMPDLAAFSNSGFPFTRLADLADTAVVLPDAPTAADYAAYLTLMGRMGESTGYPATAVTVAAAGQLGQVANKDLLVISSGDKQPLLTQWAKSLPADLNGDDKHFDLSDIVYRLVPWLDTDPRNNARPTRQQLGIRSPGASAVMAGFESPLAGGRSVVLLSANQPDGLRDMLAALDDPDLITRFQGSAVLVRGKEVDSLTADQTYHVGHLDPITYVRWALSSNPLLLALGGIVAALLLAVLLYLTLRARARQRLRD